MEKGGSEAIKGFNYQKAVAILIAVRHAKSKDLKIFLENKDDIEVEIDQIHTFIQVKSSKLSIKKLIKADIKTKKSIISKNISHKKSPARYKIVTKNDFASKDKKHLISSSQNLIFENAYEYSEDQKKDIIKTLSTQKDVDKCTLAEKIGNSFLYFTPFLNDMTQACSYIIGEMEKSDICVDNGMGRVAMTELCLQIDQKSEITTPNSTSLKTINYEQLRHIFHFPETIKYKKEITETLYNEKIISFMEKEKIEKQLVHLQALAKKLKQKCFKKTSSYQYKGDVKADFNELKKLTNNIEVEDKHQLYAVLIQLMAELYEKEINDYQ